jgi:hypothetical protein
LQVGDGDLAAPANPKQPNWKHTMPASTITLPDGLTPAEFEQTKATILQWKLGSASGAASVSPLNAFSEGNPACFNLFNQASGVYLQWEKQPLGINLGWTDHADAATAAKVSRWFVRRENGDTGTPLKYGERVALGYGTKPSFYRYDHRDVGINLGNVESPAAEWIIYGGPAGTPVQPGAMVGLYNVQVETDHGRGDFMIRHKRQGAGNIGWISSPESWRLYPFLMKHKTEIVKAVITALG